MYLQYLSDEQRREVIRAESKSGGGGGGGGGHDEDEDAPRLANLMLISTRTGKCIVYVSMFRFRLEVRLRCDAISVATEFMVGSRFGSRCG
jgi:hypothetical protein